MDSSNKHKHLDYIQDTIQRMASNSSRIKECGFALVVAIFGLQKAGIMKISSCVIMLLVFLWALDAYYLALERQYRRLYDYVRLKDNKLIDYSMDISTFKRKKDNIMRVMVTSKSLCLVYIPFVLSLAIYKRIGG